MKTHAFFAAFFPLVALAEPIAITDLKRDKPVDFATEIHPLLKKNCLACHSASKPKAGLNLESPQSMIKGGDTGPALVPGKSDASLLLTLAAHQEDPVMPPKGNKMNAEPFTSEELSLLKLWIDQGGKGQGIVLTAPPKDWRLPEETAHPIYQAALSATGRFAAAARANRVTVYDLTNQSATHLADPELAKLALYKDQAVADRDIIQSLAFSGDDWLATGAYRSVKLWRRASLAAKNEQAMPEAISALAVSSDGRHAAAGDAAGNVRVWRQDDPTQTPRMSQRHQGAVVGLGFSSDGEWLVSAGADGKLQHGRVSEQEVTVTLPGPGPIRAMALLTAAGFVATASDDGIIRLFGFPLQKDAAQPVKELKGHEKAVTGLAALANDAKGLLSGGADGTVRRWDVAAGQETKKWDQGAPVVAVAASADGQRFVSVGGATAKLWDGKDGKLVRELRETPETTRQQGEWQRAANVANHLATTRKQKLTETEKAWKEEITKAKEAAQAQEKAKLAGDKKDMAAHEAALAQGAADEQAKAGQVKWDGLKQQSGEAESEAKALDGQIAEENGRVNQFVATVEQQAAELTQAAAKLTEDLQLAEASQSATNAAREQTAIALASLKTAKEKLGDSALGQEAILATEKLLAEAEGKTNEAKARHETVATAANKARQEIAALAKSKAEAGVRLTELNAKKDEARKQAETLKQQMAQAEAQAKQWVEAAKKSSEAASKAATEKEETAKELARAIQNTELAIRLVGNSASAHAKMEAALSTAESLAAEAKGGQEATQKAASEAARPWRAVAFSADSRWVVLGHEGQITSWDAASGKGMESSTGAGTVLCFAAKGSDLLAGDSAKNIRQWKKGAEWTLAKSLGDLEKPEVLADRVTALAFDPNGTLLATGGGVPSRSGELKIWRVATGQLVASKPEAHSDTIVGLEFSPNGQYLATAGTDRFVKVFRVADLSLLANFEGHTSHVLDVTWRKDGLALASCGADNVIKLWDFEEKRQLQTIMGYDKEITSVAFLDLGASLLAGAGDNSVRLGTERLDAKDYVYHVSMSADGETLISATQDSVLRVWNPKTKQVAMEFPAVAK